MEYKDVFLKRVSKIEDKLFLSKLLDKAIKAEDTRSVTYSDFLDPYQKSLLQKTFKVDNDIKYIFNGGYPGAEREIVVFCPNNMSIYDYPNFKYPLNLIEISSRKMENLSHRDFLGALMGLGIKREKVGDILLEEGICRVIVINEIADYIKFNLDKIGKTRVDVEIKSVDEIQCQEKRFKEVNSTVASLRLDSIASAGFGISRSKIAEYIRAEKVNINWEKTVSLTKQVQEGDTISIRGKGRVVLERVGGLTRKGRISILLKKYI